MKHFHTLLVGSLVTFVGCTTSPPDEWMLERDEDGHAHPHGVQVRFAQRLSEDGTVPDNAVVRMKQQRDFMLANQLDGNKHLLKNWKWLGPGNVGGRIRAISIHPTNSNIMWCGSVGGGIWKTTTGGSTWFPLNDFAPVMSVGCMILDPKDPNRIFAGTGEGFFDTLAGTSILAASRGAGIFVSTNGGTTWTQMASTNNSNFHFVNRIAISPKDNKVMLVATMAGIFRTTDAGATWSKRTSDFAMDVDFHPTDDMLAIAGVRDGVAKYSTDGGLTWQSSTGTGWRQRSEVAYAKGSPNIVYAACSQNNRIKVYRSTNGGQTYALTTTGSGVSTYSRYNNMLWVDPSNANHILVGGVRLYKSTNAGASFVSAYSGSYYDYHVIVEHPAYNGSTNQTVYHGNDGGIYRTTAVKSSTIRWQELNNNLGITQFYGAAMTPNGRVVGGTQDNGTLLYTGNAQGWTRRIGGDGCYCAADPTNSNYVYGQIYWIRIYRSTNGGSNFSRIASRNNIPDKGSNFIPYLTLDPNDPNRMYFAGASVWRTDSVRFGTPTWRQVKLALSCTDGDPGNAHFGLDPRCNVSIIQVAKGNPNSVWVGHNHGDLYMTTNALAATPTWKRVDQVNVHPNRWVGSIAIDPRDHKKVYVSFLGYHKNNVWVTTDSGTTWKPINGTGTGALPESPANWITVHPTVPGCLFLGTDIGLFYSVDDGATWLTTTEGGATSPIQELTWRPNNRTLMVTTHGRGIYTVDVGDPASVKSIGVGCGKSAAPVLGATPPIPGRNQLYTMSGATANAPVMLMYAPATTPVVLQNNCTLQVGWAPIFVSAGKVGSNGAWSFTLPIPPLKDIIGAQLTVQAAAFVTAGPALGVAELSNGLELLGGF